MKGSRFESFNDGEQLRHELPGVGTRRNRLRNRFLSLFHFHSLLRLFFLFPVEGVNYSV